MDEGSRIKEIEAKSWKGPQDHTTKSYTYSTIWEDYLCNNSVVQGMIKGKRIVNVGGGHGKEAESFLDKGASSVVLIDIAKGQLLSAKLRIIQKSISNLDLICSDAEHLPIKTKSFDIGLVFMALHHFPDHDKAINEIIRISHEIIFIDIMNCSLTKYLTKFGLFKKEWCGIEPNRINIDLIQSIFAKNNLSLEIQYYFIPPYYGKNLLISHLLFRLSRFFSETFLFNPAIGNCFGNVAIIRGYR